MQYFDQLNPIYYIVNIYFIKRWALNYSQIQKYLQKYTFSKGMINTFYKIISGRKLEMIKDTTVNLLQKC